MKFKDKKSNLLEILYNHRFDGRMYDVVETLEQLAPTNKNEAYNIAKSLEDEGLIKMVSSKDSVGAEIIAGGIEYVESLESDDTTYHPVDPLTFEEKETLKKRLDEFSERLKTLEVGQQITYDDLIEELTTLKTLLNVLGKKDWGQILKGKLVDAGFGQLTTKVGDLIVETFKDDKLLNG